MPFVVDIEHYVGPRPPKRWNLPGLISPAVAILINAYRLAAAPGSVEPTVAIIGGASRVAVAPGSISPMLAIAGGAYRVQSAPGAVSPVVAITASAYRVRCAPGSISPTVAITGTARLKVYVSDAFGAADGTSLSGRALDVGGVSWVVVEGAIDTQSGRAHANATSSSMAVVNSGTSEQLVTTTIRWGVLNGFQNVVIRAAGASPTGPRWHAAAGGGNLQILEYITGTGYVTRATTTLSLSAGTSYILYGLATGTSLSGTLGATTVSYISSTNQSATYAGLRMFAGAVSDNLTQDDWSVRPA